MMPSRVTTLWGVEEDIETGVEINTRWVQPRLCHSLTMTPLQLLKQWPSSYNLIHSFRRTCVCAYMFVCVCGPYSLMLAYHSVKNTTDDRGGEGALSDFVTSVVSSFKKSFLVDALSNVIL